MLSKALVACTDRRLTRHLSVSARVNQHRAVCHSLITVISLIFMVLSSAE